MRNIADELQAVESAGKETDCDISRRIECFASIFETICEYEDWRLPLSSMLQPVPFQERVLAHPAFAKYFESVMRLISMDARCDVHYTVMPLREGRDGWFHLFCPGGLSCNDEGDVYALMVCFKRDRRDRF